MGVFTNKVDRKGRVSVPAPFRAALAEDAFSGIVAMRSIREGVQAIEALGRQTMIRMSESITDMFSDRSDLASGLFGEAVEVPFDGEGRIVLPDDLLAFAKITEQATFLGRGPYFQIWEPAACAAFRERLFQQLRTERSRIDLSLKSSPDGRP
jgi:MraZ protein